MADENSFDLTALTADVVSAYVSNNNINPEELGKLIGATYQALQSTGQAAAPAELETQKPDKAAIRKSVHPDHLISFIDGRKYKSLKRHLNTHSLTPNDYRKRYGLAADYPMVSSNYSAQRSELARSLGLGRKAGQGATAPEPAKAPDPAKASGRGKRADAATKS